jgi:cytochrome c oxidase assembly protein subunit 11
MANNASPPRLDPAKQRRMALSAALCFALVLGMGGLAFAAVPLYNLFCQITGFGGTPQVASAAPEQVLERTMEVRFDVTNNAALPLVFAPEQRHQTVRIGETGVAFYTVTNPTAQDVVAVAGYNVTPHKTGLYFVKIQCFCFEDMVIPAGESVRLPVMYFVDPELASDVNTEEVSAITLTYTFYPSMDAARQAAAS